MEEEVTYAEIYSAAILNSEVVITILTDDVEKTKTGIKNYKAKQAVRLREEGLAVNNDTLEFVEAPSEEGEEFTDLYVILRPRASVKVKKMHLPDNLF